MIFQILRIKSGTVRLGPGIWNQSFFLLNVTEIFQKMGVGGQERGIEMLISIENNSNVSIHLHLIVKMKKESELDKYGFSLGRHWKYLSKFILVQPTWLPGGSSMRYARVAANPFHPPDQPFPQEQRSRTRPYWKQSSTETNWPACTRACLFWFSYLDCHLKWHRTTPLDRCSHIDSHDVF